MESGESKRPPQTNTKAWIEIISKNIPDICFLLYLSATIHLGVVSTLPCLLLQRSVQAIGMTTMYTGQALWLASSLLLRCIGKSWMICPPKCSIKVLELVKWSWFGDLIFTNTALPKWLQILCKFELVCVTGVNPYKMNVLWQRLFNMFSLFSLQACVGWSQKENAWQSQIDSESTTAIKMVTSSWGINVIKMYSSEQLRIC